MNPISAANIAISVNHLIFAILGMPIVWFLAQVGWHFPGILVAIFGPMLIIDAIVWPIVYRAAKADLGR